MLFAFDNGGCRRRLAHYLSNRLSKNLYRLHHLLYQSHWQKVLEVRTSKNGRCKKGPLAFTADRFAFLWNDTLGSQFNTGC